MNPSPPFDALLPFDPAAAQEIRQVFEAIPDAVVIIDRDWRFTFANQRAVQAVGGVEMVGHDIFELFPGNAQEPFHSAYRTTMEKRTPTEFEGFNGPPLNTWFRAQAKAYGDGIIVFFSDISARKQAELREQAAANRLAQVLDVTSDAVVTLDRTWRYTFLNGNARRLIDPEDRLVGELVWNAFPALDGTPAADLYRRCMEQGVSGQIEDFYPAPLNRWFAVQAEPTPDGIAIFFRDITEQRAHDQIVRYQQELLTAVQEAGRVASWEFDTATTEIVWGAGSYDLYGYGLDNVRSAAQLRAIELPGYTEKIQAAIGHAIATNSPVTVEYAVRRSDGATVWIEGRGQPILSPDHPPRMRGISIDVTQRHLDQEDLVASEARYRVLAELNPNAIWMNSPDGKVTYANQRLLKNLGVSFQALAKGEWESPDMALIQQAWANSVATGTELHVEARMKVQGFAEDRYWELRAAPVRDAEGKILHWLGVGRDIHESRAYTAALRAEQLETERRRAELETLYATTPVGLALLEPDSFTFLNLNDREAEMLGKPRDEILGRPLREIAPPEKVPGLYDLLRTAASGTAVRNQLLEGELATQPGEHRAWSVNYAPLYNDDGTVRAISTASLEITQQRRAEAALIQSEKLAAVGRLASSISHEINNPLEAITNLLYLIALDEHLPESLKVYVHMAQSELSRVSQIATQTLRFHRQAVAPTWVTAAELVDAVVRLYTGRLANSNIRVETQYRTHTRILCFENDIRQVLNNLMANAIDAMRTGGRLVLRAHAACLRSRGNAPRTGVRITVADTGHGMSAPVLARVFEPFFTTKDLNGTGLGLWISFGIVERHQGALRVRSSQRPGRQGTVFTLFLPCEEKPAPGN